MHNRASIIPQELEGEERRNYTKNLCPYDWRDFIAYNMNYGMHATVEGEYKGWEMGLLVWRLLQMEMVMKDGMCMTPRGEMVVTGHKPTRFKGERNVGNGGRVQWFFYKLRVPRTLPKRLR